MGSVKGKNHIYPNSKCVLCGAKFPYDRFVSDKFCSRRCEQEHARYALLREAEAHWESQGRDLTKVDWDRSLRIAAIGDGHFPWVSEYALKRTYDYLQWFKPTHIIQMGDLYDFFSHSRFPKRLIITPEDEVRQGREGAVAFWRRIRSENKKAKLLQIKGNHCDRPELRQIEKCPENEIFFSTDGMFQFDGVETHLDSTEPLILGNIAFEHGYKKMGAHVRENLMCSVHGHTHRGATEFVRVRNKTIWELDCGYIADPTKEPLKYTPKKWVSWTWGIGSIDKDGPRFVTF